jgi:hypothetical protein
LFDLVPELVGGFLLGSSLVRVALNLAIATNARGGPGIVLASIVYDCGLINAGFFTALVVTAIVTSQFAALWLAHMWRRGVPLLSESGAGDLACTTSKA